MRIAVIGSPALAAEGADLALAGHDVVAASWGDGERRGILLASPIEVTGDPGQTLSGRTGPASITFASDIASAVREAALVLVDFEPADVERSFELLAPHLAAGQVIHVATYGYWAALRAWPVLERHGRTDVTITESIASPSASTLSGTEAKILWRRRHQPVAALPAIRSAEAFSVLREVYPTTRQLTNVLATGFANLNMLVHPGIALVNVGWFDRAGEAGEKASFYGAGNTAGASRLTDALDAERKAACAAWGVEWESVLIYLRDFYDAPGEDFRSAVKNCRFYAGIPEHAADLGLGWVRIDVPYAHAPFAALARLAGVPLPLQEGIVSVFGAILELSAGGALDLAGLGVEGLTVEEVREYVTTGERPTRRDARAPETRAA